MSKCAAAKISLQQILASHNFEDGVEDMFPKGQLITRSTRLQYLIKENKLVFTNVRVRFDLMSLVKGVTWVAMETVRSRSVFRNCMTYSWRQAVIEYCSVKNNRTIRVILDIESNNIVEKTYWK